MNGSITRRKKTAFIKLSSIAVYGSVFLLIATLISLSYSQSQAQKTTTNKNSSGNSLSLAINKTSVDDVVAAKVAASVAKNTNLSVADSVSNLAVTTQIVNELAQYDQASISKPQLIEMIVESRLVNSYTVLSGDTLSSIAAKFNITTQTIKWANNMTADSISEGSTLKILPTDGVLYTVKSGDTIDALATKYQIDTTRTITYNDLEVSGLVPGNSIVLPDGILPKEERPGYVSPYTLYSGTNTGLSGKTWFISYGTPAGPYAYGNCTLYAYNRRIALGLPVGSNWGNASTWATLALRDGYQVDHIPEIGAVMQNGGGLGHVAIVEDILENGDVSISEMNAYVPGGGWNIVSGRIVTAANASNYLFIH